MNKNKQAKVIRFTLRLPPELLARLDDRRKKAGYLSRNAWLVQLIKDAENG